jgi:hypothetical protein
MAYTSAKVKCNNVRTLATATIAIDKGNLISVSAINMDITDEHMTTFAQIGISKTRNTRDDIIAILCQGWVDGMTGISWTGKIQLEPDMIVFLDARSSYGADVKLSITTDQ